MTSVYKTCGRRPHSRTRVSCSYKSKLQLQAEAAVYKTKLQLQDEATATRVSYIYKTKLLKPSIYLNVHPTAAVSLNHKLARGLGAGQEVRERIKNAWHNVWYKQEYVYPYCPTPTQYYRGLGSVQTCKNMSICLA